MKNIFYPAVSAQLAAHHSVGVSKLDGYHRGTTATRYLQVHDAFITPANGVVPLKEWPVPVNSEFYKEFKNGELRTQNGLYVALSTTSGTLTLSADTMDLNVEFDSPEQNPVAGIGSSVIITGNLTSAVGSRQPWNNASGPKHLTRVWVKDLGFLQTVRYLQLHCIDSPTNANKATAVWQLTPSNGNVILALDFGKNGYSPQEQQSSGILYKACTFVISDNPTTYDDSSADSAAIRTEHIA